MSQIRVFVVDDSVVFRKLLQEAINSIPGVRTVGVAANGLEALKAIPSTKPDFITLDLNMPVMDGLETLRHLREVYPSFRVIMVSSFTVEGAQATFQALGAGALDFVTKPDGDDQDANIAYLRDQLALALGKYAGVEVNPLAHAITNAALQPHADRSYPQVPIVKCAIRPEVVALGISTGGPNALATILPMLPSDFPLPVLIVQHMPRLFTKALAESLQKKTSIRVVEAKDEEPVVPQTVYIAPGGCQMKVQKSERTEVCFHITDDPAENHCKPSADYLFRSIAQVYANKAVGVIMTGMGSDGVLGLRLMKRQGAFVIAQDRLSCTVWGMPRMAVEAGIVDAVLSLTDIPAALQRCAGVKK